MFIKYKFVHTNGEVEFFIDDESLQFSLNFGVSGFLSEYHNGKIMYTRIVINGVIFVD